MRCIILLFVIFSSSDIARADSFSETIQLEKSKVHVGHWGSHHSERPSVIFLSGPTDFWNSDSAWFALLGQMVGKTQHAIAIDRSGQVLKNPDANVGYEAFAGDLSGAIKYFDIKDVKIVSFASANLALNVFFANNPSHPVSQVVMIDPDSLNEYSIARYKRDSLPFKENLESYFAYIGDGKYEARAKEKNELEMEQLRTFVGKDFDWRYLNEIYSARLDIVNLQNLFREIARYDADLDSAQVAGFPRDIPLTIFDTDFEQKYIDASEKEEEKNEIDIWRKDMQDYYQNLTTRSIKGTYIPLLTKEHLLPFSDPALILQALENTKD